MQVSESTTSFRFRIFLRFSDHFSIILSTSGLNHVFPIPLKCVTIEDVCTQIVIRYQLQRFCPAIILKLNQKFLLSKKDKILSVICESDVLDVLPLNANEEMNKEEIRILPSKKKRKLNKKSIDMENRMHSAFSKSFSHNLDINKNSISHGNTSETCMEMGEGENMMSNSYHENVQLLNTTADALKAIQIKKQKLISLEETLKILKRNDRIFIRIPIYSQFRKCATIESIDCEQRIIRIFMDNDWNENHQSFECSFADIEELEIEPLNFVPPRILRSSQRNVHGMNDQNNERKSEFQMQEMCEEFGKTLDLNQLQMENNFELQVKVGLKIFYKTLRLVDWQPIVSRLQFGCIVEVECASEYKAITVENRNIGSTEEDIDVNVCVIQLSELCELHLFSEEDYCQKTKIREKRKSRKQKQKKKRRDLQIMQQNVRSFLDI